MTLGCEVATRTPSRSASDWYGRVAGDGGGEPAAAVAELAQDRQVHAGLGEDVAAGDADLGNGVRDELDHVVGAHEQDVERVVLDARDEAAIVGLEHEARRRRAG